MTADASSPAAELLTGLAHHQAGRLDEAETIYARVLAALPDHADALNLSGALAFQRGRVADAVALLRRAVAALPNFVDAQLNLAEALTKAGRPHDAIQTYRAVLALQPDAVEVHALIARLLSETGQGELALAHCRVALALAPAAAEPLIQQAHALRKLNRLAPAEAAYRAALALHPDNLSLLSGLASLLFEMEDFDEAAWAYRRAATLNPAEPEYLVSLANVLAGAGDLAGARAAHDRAVEVAPDSTSALRTRAFFLASIGDFEAAARDYEGTLKVDPNYVPAMLHLTRIGRGERGAAVQNRLRAIFTDESIDARGRVQAGFALGDMLDREAKFDDAFAHFAAANALYRKYRALAGEVFDLPELQNTLDLVERFIGHAQINDTKGWGNPTEQPVFVVGFPRSGTTLVEQICAGHSQVVGVGELRSLQTITTLLAQHNDGRGEIRDWDVAHARGLADKHARRLATLGRGARYVVDKLPFNVLRLGIIGALFPNAKIIWCRRDKKDIVASNHMLFFSKGNVFSTDIRECAFATVQTERAGLFWQANVKLPMLEVNYEALAADPRAHAGRIIDFLGLDWQDSCLDFTGTDRSVVTLSQWQVRQNVYTSSIGRWQRYARHLQPMFEVAGMN